MTAKIVVVGSFNADLTAYVKQLPKPGETVSGNRFVTGPGGKGSNQAVAAARLGAEVTFIGRVGKDVFGELAVRIWKEEGINTDFVVTDPENATGVAPIWVDEAGENSIIVILGANLAISTADVDAAAEVIAQADVLITQLEINYDIVAYALKIAKEKGIQTILNPAPAGKLPADVIALADIITPNETELATLTGQDGTVEENARKLLTNDEQKVIVTLGSKGCQWVSKEDSAQIPIYKVDVVDTTGAGDAFNAGLAVALAEKRSLEETIAFASATAALSVTRLGTTTSMPSRQEVDDFLAKNR